MPEAVAGQSQTGLLPHLPEQALVGALLILKLSTHSNPLVLVYIVLLFHPVEHQVLSPVILQVAQRAVEHFTPSFPSSGFPI